VQVRWTSAALFSLLSLLLTGYAYEGQDNDLWIPLIRHAVDPGLFPRDPALASPHGSLSLYVDALAALSRVVPLEWCFFVLFLACHVLSFVGVSQLAFALFGDELVVLLALCFWTVPHPLGWTAAWTLSDSMIPRVLAEAAAPFALAAVATSRAWLTGGLAFALVLVHPLSAASLLPSLAAGSVRRIRELRSLAILVGLCAAGAAIVLLRGRPPPEAPIAFSDDAWVALLRKACPYAFASEAASAVWLGLLVTGGLLAVGWLRGRLPREAAVMAAAALAWIAVTALAGEGLGLPFVLQLQSGRGLVVPILLGLIVGAAWLADLGRSGAAGAALAGALLVSVALGANSLALGLQALAAIDASRAGGAWRRAAGLVVAVTCAAGAVASRGSLVPGHPGLDLPVAALVVGAAAVAVGLRARALAGRASLLRLAALAVPALFVAVLGTRPIDLPWVARQRDDAGLAHWARTQTPVDTLFAVPVTASGFRGRALRSSIFERHDVHASFFSRRYASEWIARRNRYADDVPLGRRVEALRDGSIDVLVLWKRARRLEEPVAYEDAAYIAYVRPGSPLARSPR
jgi:hypothetical protein